MSCNQGYYAVGIYGAAGTIFDSFGLRCGKVLNGMTTEIYSGSKNSYGSGGNAFVRSSDYNSFVVTWFL